MQISGYKGFDPEVYREQIRAYNVSKVAAPKRAYQGAGDILHHPGASRPESQQVYHGIAAHSELDMPDVAHALAGMASVAASEAPASTQAGGDAMSEVGTVALGATASDAGIAAKSEHFFAA